MIEPVHILLFVVVTTLTGLSVIIGFQIFKILSEIRQILSKVNHMADDVSGITQNFGRSLKGIGGFSEGLKVAISFFKFLKKKAGMKGENDER